MPGPNDRHGEMPAGLRRLIPAPARSELDRALSVRLPNTGTWLLRDSRFLSWMQTPNSILWLNGSPGSGKTILAAAVIEYLITHNQDQNHKVGVAYYFFSQAESEKRTVVNFLATVLEQLWEDSSDLCPENFYHILSESDGSLDASDLFDSLVETIGKINHVYIVIDALDECNVNERKLLFDLIDKLEGYQDKTDCRLLIASRQNADILTMMRRRRFYHDIHLVQSETAQDVSAYVRHTISHKKRLNVLSRSRQEYLVNTVVEHSNGMFLHAGLQLAGFATWTKEDISFGETVESILNPKGLFEIYGNILTALEPESRPVVAASLRWLACAFEPLTVNALDAAVRLNTDLPGIPTAPSEISKLFGDLVQTRETNPTDQQGDGAILTCRFFHASVVEFLYEEGLAEFGIDAHSTHEHVAESCLDSIISYAYSQERTSTMVDFEKFPLLQYACRHWLDHSKKHQSSATRLEELAEKLFASKDLTDSWLSVHDPEDLTKPPFTASRNKTPLLHYAVRTGLPNLVRVLLGNDIDVAATDVNGKQALHVAVEVAIRGDIVEQLLAQGAKPTSEDKDGRIPIVMAASANQSSLTKKLYDHTTGEDLYRIRSDGLTLIHSLAEKASEGIFRLFSRMPGSTVPVNMNMMDSQGCSPLHRAVKACNLAVMSDLIAMGADVNFRNAEKNTPLHFAAGLDREPERELLIENGADPWLRNANGETPLEMAWKEKALIWTCYEIDPDRSTENKVTTGSQAACHVLRKTMPCGGQVELCRRLEEPCQCPKFIFRKRYDFSRVERSVVEQLHKAQLRECWNLQRVDHPFIVSYLGYEEFRPEESDSPAAILYLEYCPGGDLGTLHVRPNPPTPEANSSDDDEETSPTRWNRFFQASKSSIALDEDVTPLNEADVWTLMYQLFLALAYLHYGVKITADGKCHCEGNWKPLIHRDIKPNNVVMSHDKDGFRVAKLCDLGLSRDVRDKQTIPRYVGTNGYQPPEVFVGGLGKKESIWSSKGDVWCLGKTIDALYKDFTPGEAMRRILDRCQEENPALRQNSLEVVEEVHKYVAKPFHSLQEILGKGENGFFMQAFFIIAQRLDRYTAFDTKMSTHPRKTLIKRLELMLKDGAEGRFQDISNSLHFAVLLGKNDMLKVLLEKGQNPDENWSESLWTPLHLAVQQGQLEMVRELLKKTPDKAKSVRMEDRAGISPIGYAEQLGHTEILKLMLDHVEKC